MHIMFYAHAYRVGTCTRLTIDCDICAQKMYIACRTPVLHNRKTPRYACVNACTINLVAVPLATRHASRSYLQTWWLPNVRLGGERLGYMWLPRFGCHPGCWVYTKNICNLKYITCVCLLFMPLQTAFRPKNVFRHCAVVRRRVRCVDYSHRNSQYRWRVAG